RHAAAAGRHPRGPGRARRPSPAAVAGAAARRPASALRRGAGAMAGPAHRRRARSASRLPAAGALRTPLRVRRRDPLPHRSALPAAPPADRSRRLPGGARRRRAAFPPALRARAAGAQPAAGRQRRARARSGAAVRTGRAGTGARDIAGAGAGAVGLRRGTATLRAAGHRPVRYPPGRRPGLAGTAGAAAGTSRRRGGAPLRPAARSASGTGDAARARGRSGRGAHRHAPAPPDLAAGAPHSPARPGADRAGRARTHRIGLVGWRRPASRLLRGAHRQRPARLGVLPRRRARAVDAAWLVRMKVVSLAARVRDAGSSGRQPPEPKLPGYAELHCLSHFSFGRGASSALELFRRARQQGYAALAITDECSLAGIVRAWEASKETELPLITGSEFTLGDGLKLVLLVEDEAGYSRLCRLITLARMRCED